MNKKDTLILDFDSELCCSCGACSIACMDQNDYDTSTGSAPFRSVFETEDAEGNSVLPSFHHFSTACMHCDPAPCITACPSGCISKDPDTNFTIYNNTNCVGCHSCAMACPFGAPSFNAAGKMIKCDGCYVRVRFGLEPACVRVCPTGALRLVTEEEYQISHAPGSIIPEAKEIAEHQI